MVEVCRVLVLGVARKEEEEDQWQWVVEKYKVKKAYMSLSRCESEDLIWTKDVWSPLIPTKLSTLVWRLLQNRLPTKKNLMKRGISFNSSVLCVGVCGKAETENHLFFNCPNLAVSWRELVKWIGIPIVLPEGGYDHLVMFKGLICGKAKIKEMLGVIWISNIYSIWKARNAMIFN
jgi:hypothetical protein